jgi:hypothetical protein
MALVGGTSAAARRSIAPRVCVFVGSEQSMTILVVTRVLSLAVHKAASRNRLGRVGLGPSSGLSAVGPLPVGPA